MNWFAVAVEVFWKSGVALGAGLVASALLRQKSADLRRLVLTASLLALAVAAVAVPALPRWTAVAPGWLRLPRSSASAALHPATIEAPAPLSQLPPVALRPAAANGTPRRSPLHLPLIPALWLAGAVLLLIRFLAGLRALRRLRLGSRPLADYTLPERVALLRNDAIGSPVTWGILRPVILVPGRFAELPEECRRQVLCHELAHIQSGDFAARALAELARAVLWFQPLVWMVRRQLREEQELACDNRVLAAGGRSSAYARLLLDWDGGLRSRDALIAVGMAQRSCLKRRLEALLDGDARRETVSRASTSAACLLALSAALPLAAVDLAPPVQPRPAMAATPAAKPAPPAVSAAPQTPVFAQAAAPSAPAVEPAAPEPPAEQEPLTFEVASLKPGPPGDYSASGSGGPGTHDPTRWSVENYPVSSLLGIAYGIRDYQLSGPGWMEEERFTIDARLPKETTGKQLAEMLRNLMVERFHLAAHFEKKDLAGYALTVGKSGPKLAPSPGDPDLEADDPKAADFKWTLDKDGFPNLPPGRKYAMSMASDKARWRFADESMEHFAEALGDQIRRPILDATGLGGKYDFTITWSYADSGPSIDAALQEQVGLKLESRKVPVDVLVIDRLDKTPAGN